jgi:hypothetical protein
MHSAAAVIGEMGVLMRDDGCLVLPGLSAAASAPAAPATPVRSASDLAAAELEARDELRLPSGACEPDAAAVAAAVAASAAPTAGAPRGRRTASVKAVSEVEVLVLRRRQLEWIMQHDGRVREELVAAIELRQAELRAAHSAHDAEHAARTEAAIDGLRVCGV